MARAFGYAYGESMAKDKNQLNIARTKLIAGIIVPVLIMVLVITTIGISFAWFSETSTANVSTLKLATTSVFTLSFTAQTGEEDNKYMGQTAFDGDGFLITDKRAELKGLDSVAYEMYMQDAPFERVTPINLDTDGKMAEINVSFSSLVITNTYTGENLIKIDDINGTSEDIRYGFTWYLTAKNNSDVLYTPYGRLTKSAGEYSFDEDFKLSNLADFNAAAATEPKDYNFEFHIVFCPEKLYWLQYLDAESGPDWESGLSEVYTETFIDKHGEEKNETEKIIIPGNGYQPYYSTPLYTGASFELSATLTVVSVED